MAEREQVIPLALAQVRPLSPAVDGRTSDEDETTLPLKRFHRRKFIKWCGCLTAFLLLIAVVIVVLIFTVFRVKGPKVRMNGIKVTKLELINNNTTPKPGVNISLLADISVKNSNAVSFKYSNTTTTLSYHGTVVGEARGPPGQAKARRTIRMNVSVDIIPDRLMASPNLSSEVNSGILSMNSYTVIPGKMKILVYKKHIVVRMNCSVTLNISTQAIQDLKCKRKIKL